MNKPVVNEKLMEILNMLDQDIRHTRSARTVQECCATKTPKELKRQAHDQIIELFRECLPKKRKEKLSLKDYIFLNTISQEDLERDEERNKIFNSAITEAEKKIGNI